MKKLGIILIVLIILLIGIAIAKDAIIQSTITTVGSSIVGAPISIGHFSLGLMSQKVDIKDFKLFNPPGFPKEPLITINRVAVDFDVSSILKNKLHLPLVIFDLKEMVVVKNKDGKLNVDSLKVIEEQKAAAEQKKAEKKGDEKPKAAAKEMAIQIDVLRLNVEKVILKDFSGGGENPSIQVFEVALKDKEFKNITSVQKMTTLIMAQAMGPTAIKSAGVYAVATILGVGFLPVGVAGMLVGKDDSTAEFSKSFDAVYSAALAMMQEKGEVKSEDKAAGLIKGKMDKADVTIKIEQKDSKVTVTASARQMMMPKKELAGGVIYKLQERLK